MVELEGHGALLPQPRKCGTTRSRQDARPILCVQCQGDSLEQVSIQPVGNATPHTEDPRRLVTIKDPTAEFGQRIFTWRAGLAHNIMLKHVAMLRASLFSMHMRTLVGPVPPRWRCRTPGLSAAPAQPHAAQLGHGGDARCKRSAISPQASSTRLRLFPCSVSAPNPPTRAHAKSARAIRKATSGAHCCTTPPNPRSRGVGSRC